DMRSRRGRSERPFAAPGIDAVISGLYNVIVLSVSKTCPESWRLSNAPGKRGSRSVSRFEPLLVQAAPIEPGIVLEGNPSVFLMLVVQASQSFHKACVSGITGLWCVGR